MLLMTAINLEGLECNWRIKVTVSGELQQDFHSLFFNGTENGRRRTRFAHSIVGDNGSLNPRTTQKKPFPASKEYQFEKLQEHFPWVIK